MKQISRMIDVARDLILAAERDLWKTPKRAIVR